MLIIFDVGTIGPWAHFGVDIRETRFRTQGGHPKISIFGCVDLKWGKTPQAVWVGVLAS